jgi:hypothetical protein
VIMKIMPGEYEQTFAQIEAVLQALAACEKLEPQAARSAGPLMN